MKSKWMHFGCVSFALFLCSCHADQSRPPENVIIEVKEGIPPAGIQYRYAHSQANKKGMWVNYKITDAGTPYNLKIAVAVNEGDSTWYEIQDSRIGMTQLQKVSKSCNVEKSFLVKDKSYIRQEIIDLRETTDLEAPADGKIEKAQKILNNKKMSTTVEQSVIETPTGEEKNIRFEWSEQVPGLFMFSKFGGLVAFSDGRQIVLEDFGTDAQTIPPPIEKDKTR